MVDLDRLHRGVRFLDDHLRDEVSIRDAARASCWSLYHFTRTFNAATGHSPYEYLVRRRLSESVADLAREGSSVTDVAFSWRFGCLESYSRAFHRMFGITPHRARTEGQLERLPVRTALSLPYLRHLNRGGHRLIPTRIAPGRLALSGLAGTEGDWASLWALMERCGRPLPDVRYQVTVLSGGQGALYRMAAVEGGGSLPLLSLDLPAVDWARFEHLGTRAELGHTLDYARNTWLPRSGLARALPVWLLRVDGEADEVWLPVRERPRPGRAGPGG